MESKLNDPNFGSNKPSEDPYQQTRDTLKSGKQIREEREFERKLRREVKYGRVSQESRSKLERDAINGFINQIISQKQASLNAVNTVTSTGGVSNQDRVNIVTSSSEQFDFPENTFMPASSKAVVPPSVPNGSNFGDILYWSGKSWIVLAAPAGSSISIKQFSVCENGQPKQYNMLVWDQGA